MTKVQVNTLEQTMTNLNILATQYIEELKEELLNKENYFQFEREERHKKQIEASFNYVAELESEPIHQHYRLLEIFFKSAEENKPFFVYGVGNVDSLKKDIKELLYGEQNHRQIALYNVWELCYVQVRETKKA